MKHKKILLITIKFVLLILLLIGYSKLNSNLYELNNNEHSRNYNAVNRKITLNKGASISNYSRGGDTNIEDDDDDGIILFSFEKKV